MSHRTAALVLALLALAAVAVPRGGSAQEPEGRDAGSAAARLDLVGRFAGPVHVAAPPADQERIFVVERAGTVRVVRNGQENDRPFLDIRSRVRCCGEQGLLSIAFAPDYETSRRFYVFLTERPSGDLRVLEYRASPDPDRADPDTARSIMRVGHRRFTNHNGGQLAFGPDGLLYISTGDGGGGGDPLRNGQNRRSRLGKILRVDPRRAGAPAVYAYGLRNPYRFSFDRSTGDISIADVGEGAIEEVNFMPRGRARGANFGWSVFEGTRRFRRGTARGHRRPVIQHSHSAGWCSIIGGFVVRDRSLTDLFGRYVYGDFCKGDLYAAQLDSVGARGVRRVGLRVPSLSSFGEDAEGHIYATSLGGAVYRLR